MLKAACSQVHVRLAAPEKGPGQDIQDIDRSKSGN
jgi:hypothetical protein